MLLYLGLLGRRFFLFLRRYLIIVNNYSLYSNSLTDASFLSCLHRLY